jgi:hypothetical protein
MSKNKVSKNWHPNSFSVKDGKILFQAPVSAPSSAFEAETKSFEKTGEQARFHAKNMACDFSTFVKDLTKFDFNLVGAYYSTIKGQLYLNVIFKRESDAHSESQQIVRFIDKQILDKVFYCQIFDNKEAGISIYCQPANGSSGIHSLNVFQPEKNPDDITVVKFAYCITEADIDKWMKENHTQP